MRDIPPSVCCIIDHTALYEDMATRLKRVVSRVFMHGLLQTEAYARALLETSPGVSDEVVAARLASRMSRQRRVLMRDIPPSAQMRHLAEAARLSRVTVQVLPATPLTVRA